MWSQDGERQEQRRVHVETRMGGVGEQASDEAPGSPTAREKMRREKHGGADQERPVTLETK